MADADGAVPVSIVALVRPLSEQDENDNARTCAGVSVDEAGSMDDCVMLTNFKSPEEDVLLPVRKVFDSNATQIEVYGSIREDMMTSIFSGYNYTLVFFGAPTTGKTYALFGTPDDLGIYPRAIAELYDRIQQLPADIAVDVKFSYFEVNDDTVIDLLSGSSAPLKLRRDADSADGVIIDGLKEISAPDLSRLERCVAVGNAARARGIEQRGTRWHGFMKIKLVQYNRHSPDTETTSELLVAHLKGSDRLAKKGVVGDHLKEGGKINKSLSSFSHIVKVLADNPNASKQSGNYVPYGNSKFTELFRRILGGNSITTFIVTLSSSEFDYYESFEVLHVCGNLRKIMNHPVPNEHLTEYGKMKQEISDLQAKIPQNTLAAGHPPTEDEERLRRLQRAFQKKFHPEDIDDESSSDEGESEIDDDGTGVDDDAAAPSALMLSQANETQLWKVREHLSLKDGNRATVFIPTSRPARPTQERGKPKKKVETVTYKGEWRGDVKEGFGVEETKAYKYEGHWADGKRDGHGTLWEKIHIPASVSGVKKIPAKTKLARVYVGEWQNGLRDGFGTYFYKNGEIYEGAWSEDARHGNGKYFHSNGDVYEGEWIDDKRCGWGRLFKENGDFYEGQWDNDLRDGPGCFYYREKKRYYEGEWKDGVAKCGTLGAWDPDDDSNQYGGERGLPLPKLELKNAEKVLHDQVQAIRQEQ